MAKRARQGRGRSKLQSAIAKRKMSKAIIMSNSKPVSSGVQAIGFLQLAVAAGTQATITTQPQTWFKPMRLVVPGSIAPFFTIDNLIVGNKSQFPSPTPLPAETFIPEAQAVVMDLDTVNPALNMTIMATNKAAPSDLIVGIEGAAITLLSPPFFFGSYHNAGTIFRQARPYKIPQSSRRCARRRRGHEGPS
jgi:hypothetical protein